MSMRPQLILIAFLTLLCVHTSSACAEMIFSDPIDENDGWVLSGGSWGDQNAISGLTPNAGSTYWGSTSIARTITGLSKEFALTVEPGRYTLSIDVSAPFGPPNVYAVPYSDFTAFGLTGISSSPTALFTPTPPELTRSWTTWSISYDVAPGSADIGNTIGFNASLFSDDYTVMLDNLKIVHAVPEPSSMVLFGLAASSLAGFTTWKRRRKQKPADNDCLNE